LRVTNQIIDEKKEKSKKEKREKFAQENAHKFIFMLAIMGGEKDRNDEIK
jgi:hypothetical protein